mmetsp:Transcript_80132/g.151343  ORF Transcript_80132/g.151343 Transcript_80132/m.151343 type:complete len:729 (+) Transcript_80132:96-2282(+)
MAFVRLSLVFSLLAATSCTVGAELQVTSANPIRKVVTMLQSMQKKITAEGEKEAALYEKFECYCKGGKGDLEASIASANIAVPQLGKDIEAKEAKLAQTKEDLKSAKVSRDEAKAAIADATAVREKEAAAFAKESTEYKTNIAAIKSAVSAISKGATGLFLQSNSAKLVLQAIDAKQDMIEADRQELVAFLSGGQASTDEVPGSAEIVGLLKQLDDEMSATLASITKDEKAAIASFEAIVAAKKKEIAALTLQIEAKTKSVGELGVEIATMKGDLSDTEAALIADQKFLANLESDCATKAAEWAEIQKTRSTELAAVAETIKILNDDDALEVFKKTLPSASASSFVQVKVRTDQKAKALAAVQQSIAKFGDVLPRLDFIALALHGKTVGFEKVIKMIDEMVATLKTEQLDDDHKKEYCEAQFDASEDKTKALERSISGLETEIADLEESIATMASEIKALIAGIASLDKSVSEATEQRQEEHEEYVELMASDSAAKELLDFAKNRLNKFYNPTLYKAPPTTTLSMEDKLYVEGGGVLPTTPPPGGIAGTGVEVAASFVQISAHSFGKVAPPPPPETMAAYSKKSSESTGVIAMIDMLIKDLSTEMTEAKVTEENSQKEYVALMADSKEKRADDSKTLSDKTAAKATAEADLTAATADKDSTTKELMATEKYIADMHAECDWLLKYFDTRAEARAGEVESLKKAKDVLSGADYSLLQVRGISRSLRGAL